MKKRIFTIDEGWKEVRAYLPFEHFGESFFIHRTYKTDIPSSKYTCSHEGTGTKAGCGPTMEGAKAVAIMQLNTAGEVRTKSALIERGKDIERLIESQKAEQ